MANIATPAIEIRTPIPISTDFVIPVRVFEDAAKRKRKDISGETIKLLVLNPGVATAASAHSYTATATSAAAGQAYFTLNKDNHATTGIANAQVHVDDVLRARFKIEFVTKYS